MFVTDKGMFLLSLASQNGQLARLKKCSCASKELTEEICQPLGQEVTVRFINWLKE